MTFMGFLAHMWYQRNSPLRQKSLEHGSIVEFDSWISGRFSWKNFHSSIIKLMQLLGMPTGNSMLKKLKENFSQKINFNKNLKE
jgi:hypothetical protein